MSVLKPLFMCLGMFSVLPVPKNSWDEKYKSVVAVYLPIVGAIIGVIWFCVASVITVTPTPPMLKSVFILIIPFVLSGFLHVDGFMDTMDAIMSRRSLEDKRRILKDSHVGAFAVISFVCMFLIQLCSIYYIANYIIFLFVPVVSRCVAVLGLLNLKPISSTGYMAAFKENTKPIHSIITIAIMLIAFVIAYMFFGFNMSACLMATVLFAALALRYAYRQLDGLSGDLCGFVITIGEMFGFVFAAIMYS